MNLTVEVAPTEAEAFRLMAEDEVLRAARRMSPPRDMLLQVRGVSQPFAADPERVESVVESAEHLAGVNPDRVEERPPSSEIIRIRKSLRDGFLHPDGLTQVPGVDPSVIV